MARYADRLAGPLLGGQSLRGYLTGSIDAVLRVPDGSGYRYLVVDYKTNWLGDPERALSAADYDRPRLVEAMLHSDYPLQALLYSAVLHRFLRWRVPDYDPDRHLGGILYLFVRGMCGPDTPIVDGHPSGVFSWQPPPSLIVALSDLLDAGSGGRVTLEAIAAEGLLRTFSDAEVFEVADIHVAQRLTALVGEADERVALAVALVVRALRGGSVCVDLREAQAQVGISRPPVARCRRLDGRRAGQPIARVATGAAAAR